MTFKYESSASRGESRIQVAIDESGNFGIWSKSNHRSAALILRGIADELDEVADLDESGVGL